jgi:hypothetical protein
MNRWCAAASISVSFAALGAAAFGMWSMPESIPVARVVANAGAYVHEHPGDANGHYVLARAHGLAFVLRSATVNVSRNSTTSPLPELSSDDFQYPMGRTPSATISQDERLIHLDESVTHFQSALMLDDKPAHYHLSYAYVLEGGAALADRASLVPGAPAANLPKARLDEFEAITAKLASTDEPTRVAASAELAKALPEVAPILFKRRADPDEHTRDAIRLLLEQHWREQAITEYFAAYKRAIDQDLTIKEQPIRGLDTLVAYEAGTSYLHLVRARGVTAAEQAQVDLVAADIKKLEEKPQRFIVTPIIFSITDPALLSELLDSSHSACFDLDGSGRPQCWLWVRPGTGILVWDPGMTGRITSGRQLFGSVTFWMFFQDGYHALDVLDDNRDGVLSGSELRGLSVWFDLNGDGMSNPGEVVPVERLGIRSIATRATSEEAGGPANREGLTMKDGRTLPTYDWIAHPIEVRSGSGG